MNCASELQSLIAADCDNPAVAGLYGEATILPSDAIDRAASTVTANVISEIAMKTGKKGVTFDSFENTSLGATSITAGTYRNTLQHDVTLRIFVKTEAAKAFLNSLINARVVIILKNKEGGTSGETTYEAYGWDGGLKLNTLNADTTMADGVVYELVLGNDEVSKEKSLPKSVWAGTLAETETMLGTLTAAAA